MELIQVSFQTSFDARVERLNATELAELRTIFRYFDTDNDGAVSSDQACRMFALLGLDVNPMHVQDLEEVYLNEFIKIVDSHVPVPPAVEGPVAVVDSGEPNQLESLASLAAAPLVPALPITDPSAAKAVGLGGPIETVGGVTSPNNDSNDADAAPVLDEDTLRQRQEQLWADEWKLVDTYQRGYVSMDELRLFLASCASRIPACDLVRFFEMYGESRASAVVTTTAAEEPTGNANGGNDDDEVFVLSKTGFLKFRKDCTEKDAPDSDRGLSSNENDDANDEEDAMVQEETARGGEDPSLVDGSEASADKRRQRDRRSSHRSGDGATSSRSLTSSHRHSIIIVDPGVLDQSDVSDDGDEHESDDGAESHDPIH